MRFYERQKRQEERKREWELCEKEKATPGQNSRNYRQIQKKGKLSMKDIELYNDSFQNYKVYGLPKAQLIIADVPYCYDTETECFTRKRLEKIY